MKRAATPHRKLIAINPSVFDSLSLEAAQQEIPESGISRLIGSALPKNADIDSINDDRLKYLLSK